MLEIEIKARCSDLERMERMVVGKGGVAGERRREEDLYFNHPARDFAVTDEAFRMRSAGDYHALTYKGPKMAGRSKTRYEAEVEIGDPAVMKDILAKLGFREVSVVEKERAMYTLGDITVCLDRVAGVGDFVELEKMGEDREAVEAGLFALAADLGLVEFERRSYLEMLLEKTGRGGG